MFRAIKTLPISSVALLGGLNLILIVILSDQVPSRYLNPIYIYWFLLMAGILYQRLAIKRRIQYPVLFGSFAVTIAALLKASLIFRDPSLPSTIELIPLLLTLHLAVVGFGFIRRWPARKIWVFSILLVLSAFFIDGFFWFPSAGYILPLIVAPGINIHLIRNRINATGRSPLVYFFLFLTVIIISAIWNRSMSTTLPRAFLFLMPALFLIGSRRIMWRQGIMLVVFLNLLLFVIQLVRLQDKFFEVVLHEFNTNRVAAYFAYGGVAYLVFFWERLTRNGEDRFAWVKLLLFALPCVLLFFFLDSEGANLAALFGAGLFLLLHFSKRKLSPLVLAPILVSIVLLLFSLLFGFGALSTHLPFFEEFNKLSHSRLELWIIFWEEYTHRSVDLFIGSGPFAMDTLAGQLPPADRRSLNVFSLIESNAGIYVHSHNLILEFLSGTGILGLSCILLLILIWYTKARDLPGFVPAAALFGTVSLHGIIDFLMDIPALSLFFWMSLIDTVPNSSISISNERPRREHRKLLLLLASSLVIPVIASLVAIQHFRLEKELQRKALTLIQLNLPFRVCLGAYFKDYNAIENRAPSEASEMALRPDQPLRPPKAPFSTHFLAGPELSKRIASLQLFTFEITGNVTHGYQALQSFEQCIQDSRYSAICRYGAFRTSSLLASETKIEFLEEEFLAAFPAADPLGLLNGCRLTNMSGRVLRVIPSGAFFE